MDRTGLLVETILQSVYSIDLGRKGLAKKGTTEEGRELFSDGLLTALDVFKEVHDNMADDMETAIHVEHAYQTEEQRYCNDAEPEVLASTTAALASFEDALLALKVVNDATLYQGADKTWPHLPKYRYKDMPKDALHIACMANYTRINNTLRTPGINPIERQVFEQRQKNMKAMQSAYLAKQNTALCLEPRF
jgi:hypothetical protein